uniref:Uncharacterized protein n=1 Tax=Podoviridae sp. ctx0K11 TaxID=2825287 RepID=A0A8S5QEH1_9CAUD|nr:MAG TPA: hypothetical protein [Podoviridae sp. ctx0K11]
MNQLKEAILMASFFCIFPKYFNKTLILHIYSLFFYILQISPAKPNVVVNRFIIHSPLIKPNLHPCHFARAKLGVFCKTCNNSIFYNNTKLYFNFRINYYIMYYFILTILLQYVLFY